MMLLRAATRFLLPALLLCGFLAAAPVRAADGPTGFINDMGKRAIDVLTSTKSEAERESNFRKLFDEGFDVPAIGRFVLGPYWRTATEDQRKEFLTLFEAYVVHAYTVRFNEYNNEQFKVDAAKADSDASSLVSSQIVRGGGAPPVKVDWRVVKAADSGYKISDVIVEGVSMAVTQRQEFASVIQRGGGQLEALLKLLREKTGKQ
jgi:phospholipid transport system substrate-binding protein